MKVLLALVPVMLFAAACGGGDDELVKNADGLFIIERLDLADADLEVADLFEPDFSNPYPEVVATVNGEEISGKDLFVKQIAQELQRREAISRWVNVVLLMDTGGSADRPLESIIEERLLIQAVVHHDLAPPASNYEASALEEDIMRFAAEEIEEVLSLQGLPAEGWASSGPLVEKYRLGEGMASLAGRECRPLHFEIPIRSLCSTFVAAERENAVIEYFVAWAD